MMQVKKLIGAVSQKAVALIGLSAAPKFEYQSNDIIATLEDLLATFKKMKKDLDFEEHDINAQFERTKLGLSNEKKFAEKDKAEKEVIVESKTEQLEAAKTDKDAETNDRNADDAFMKELTKECEDKAAQFDQRSSTRAEELTALTEATAELQKGAVPNFEANKKLVGLQKAAKAPKSSPVSFVQISNVQHQNAHKDAAIQKAKSFLATAAGRTGSRMLSTMA